MTVFYNLHWATPWFCFVFNITATIKTPNQIESLVSTFTLFLCVRSNILRCLSNVLNNQQEVSLKLSSFIYFCNHHSLYLFHHILIIKSWYWLLFTWDILVCKNHLTILILTISNLSSDKKFHCHRKMFLLYTND